MKRPAANLKKWGFIIIVLVLLAFPADAAYTTMSAENVPSYSLAAGPNDYIYEVMIDSLPVGTNQSHVMSFNGYTYLLTINTVHSFGVNNEFWVNLTYPNGTVESAHGGQTSVFQTYKTKIQPVRVQMQGFTMLQIDLAIGTNPTTITFSDLEGLSYDMKTAIPWTSVSGQFNGQKSTVYAYQCSRTEFENDIAKGHLLINLGIVGDFFAWSWPAVLNLIGMIPVIGPQFVSVMTFMYTVTAEAIFWIAYIIQNSWLIIGGLEVLIAMMAFILAGKRPTPEKVVKQWVNYNVRTIKGFVWLVGFVYEWLRSFVETIAHIIGALKPI